MMSNLQVADKPAPSSLHWPSLVQLIFSLVGSILLMGAAVVIVLSAVFFNGSTNPRDPTEPFMVAASLAFAGILVLPSAWYAWRDIAYPNRKPISRPQRRGFGIALTLIVIIFVLGALLLGNWSSQNNRLTWLLLPPLNIIATGLPALWVIYIGTRGLISGDPRHKWGVFGSGLVLGPLIILVLELLLLVFIGAIALFYVMLNPALSGQFNALVYRLQNTGANPEAILKLLTPFLLNPGIIFLVFAFVSVLVPLLEEAIKPIGVWFMAGQKLTPAQGFAYGVLSGAGFGLFENLGNTSGGAIDWAILASTRISTLLLHCFTAGLVGWALVLAWNEKRYVRLAVTYLIAVLIHGLWNGLALLTLASSLQEITNTSLPTYLLQAGSVSAFGIIVLGIMVFILYFGVNYAFQRRAQASVPPAFGEQLSALKEDHPSNVHNQSIQRITGSAAIQSPSTEENPSNPEDGSSSQPPGDNST